MISVVILGLGFLNKHEFATLFFGGAFTLPQGRKEAPNIILCCMQSAWYVKMEFEHTHTALALSFSDNSFAQRLRLIRVGPRLGSGIS